MGRIFYFCPDFPQPSGGVKTLYRHVHRLCQLGFDAAIVHQKAGFTLNWHDYQVPVSWLEHRPQFQRDDAWVIPEVMVEFVRQTQSFGGKRVVIVLSWSPAYNRLPPGKRWQDFGIQQVLTKSPMMQAYLEWSMEIRATLIHEYVDQRLYVHQPALKINKVAYLTRKDASGDWLRGILVRKHPQLATFTWQPLRELNEATYAHHLRTASIYLATTLQEGMHVSVLEAMAAGCLVVGYSGIGGADYMVGAGAQQNCILVENGNLPQLGKTLEEVLLHWVADRTHYERIIANAVTTAQRYQGPALEAQSLQAFFTQLLLSNF
jgi:glycosyltransferase involved in cell wall biosynthesis